MALTISRATASRSRCSTSCPKISSSDGAFIKSRRFSTETNSDVKPTLRLHHLKFPVVLDPRHEIFAAYRADKSLPYSVVVDSTGNIVETFNGFSENMIPRLKELTAAASRPHAS